MYCNGCGQALVAGQAFCPRCGKENQAGVPVPPPYVPSRPGFFGMLPMALIERRINALGVAWCIYAALIFVTGFMGLAFVHAFMGNHMEHWGDHGFGPRFGHLPFMPLWIHFAVPMLICRVLLAVAAGVGLLQKASWGRWVAILAAILGVLHLPFGTAIGVWTLVVLLNGTNAAGYDAMVQERGYSPGF